MGDSANQTRDEIVRLRAEMTGKVIELRKATERPIRIAKTAAMGAAAVVVMGGIAIVVIGARHRAERKSLKRRMAQAVGAAASPAKTAKEAAKAIDKSIEETREKLREKLREELKKEIKEKRPMRERILTAALRSAASAAVPIVLKQLEQRISAGPNGKGAAATSTGAGSPRR
jgi:hypothetical protein